MLVPQSVDCTNFTIFSESFNIIGIAFSLVVAYDASNDKCKEEKQWGEIINRAKAMNP